MFSTSNAYLIELLPSFNICFCVLCHKRKFRERLMEIKHFGDKHRLKLRDTAPDDMTVCRACQEYCSGPTYGCKRCFFFLHKTCAEMPGEIQNPFHPHPLTLLGSDGCTSYRLCDACRTKTWGFTYCCNQCDFELDVKCAFLMPTIEGDKQIQHSSHLHPLALIEKKDDDESRCSACWKYCSGGPTYGCIPCLFFLHQSCAELQLPQQIQHFFHPCTLTLSTKTNYISCRACNGSGFGFSYSCEECKFDLEVECALLPNTIKSDSEEQLYHFSHGHPLTLCVKKEDDEVHCSACEKRCSGPTYVCDRCKFFLHESCVGLPREIRHPFHPSHSLTLLTKPTKFTSRCDACCCYLRGFTYLCAQCDFNLHIGCSELMPTIQYEGHSHLLTFIEKIDAKVIKCISCKTYCESPVFRCVECDFSLHLLCGPLPCTIKDNCHIDPLTLSDSPVDDDWNGFSCHVCEKERDPRPSIYYCAECNFIAEITCVISKVILSLKGEYGDVELRASASQITGKVISKSSIIKRIEQKDAEQDSKTNNNTQKEEVEIKTILTLHDILNSFTEDENLELNGVLEATRKEMVGTRKILSYDGQNRDSDSIIKDYQTEHSDSIQEVFLFSDKAYKLFLEILDSGIENSMTLWEDEEVVTVRDYMVTRSLAPILEDVCAKYGDISANSTLRPRVKMFFFVMLCGTMDSMLKTNVVDIYENLLFSWWKYLKTLQFAGFKIQFAFDHLKRVAHAWIGIKVRRQVDNTLAVLNRDIKEISYDVEDLTIKLEDKKAQLEKLKEKRELITSAESAKSSLIEECLTEASILKWRRAGAGLL